MTKLKINTKNNTNTKTEAIINDTEYDITKPVENPTAQDLAEVEAFNDELKFAEYKRRIKSGELTDADRYLMDIFDFKVQ